MDFVSEPTQSESNAGYREVIRLQFGNPFGGDSALIVIGKKIPGQNKLLYSYTIRDTRFDPWVQVYISNINNPDNRFVTENDEVVRDISSYGFEYQTGFLQYMGIPTFSRHVGDYSPVSIKNNRN
ncbi:MAG: hypothetical protein WCJ19_00145 [bacterium]